MTRQGLDAGARLAGNDPGVLGALRVLVVGAGGVGGHVVLDLALAGARLRVVDFDSFAEANRPLAPLLPRPVGPLPAGLSKAAISAEGALARSTADSPDIAYHHGRIEELGHAAFEGVDVVVAATDTWGSRLYLQRLASAWGVSFVTGGITAAGWDISVFPASVDDPERHPCWACTLDRTLVDDPALGCGVAAAGVIEMGGLPATQPAAASLAASMVTASVDIAHGRAGESWRGWFDMRTHTSARAHPALDPGCASAHRREPPARTSGLGVDATVRALLAEQALEDEPVIDLPRAFRREALCPTCRGRIAVGAPVSAWLRTPRCTQHGGPWAVVGDGSGAPAADLHVQADPTDVLDLPMRAIGLAPGDRLTVWASGEPVRIRLAGTVPWRKP